MYFISVDQITGEVQSSAILARLQSWNILITICRGQGIMGYPSFLEFKDAFSNNSPLSFLYTLPSTSAKSVCRQSLWYFCKYFNYSPKRQHFFVSIISQNSVDSNITKLKKKVKLGGLNVLMLMLLS